MAVQAYEHPSNALHRDPRVRRCEQEVLMVHESSVDHHPQSELTCSGSGSKKRTRANDITSMAISQQLLDHRVYGSLGASISGRPANVVSTAGVSITPAAFVPTCLSRDIVTGFNNQSTAEGSIAPAALVPIYLSKDLVTGIYNQSAEIDALVRLQTEQLRSGLEILRKRHFSTLLSVAEQQAAKRLKYKEIELQIATRRNAELEEKIRQVAAESQAWFTVAKNNESIALSLKTMLDQVLIQNAEPAADEGYGDNTDDAESCCDRRSDGEEEEEKEALRQRRACRACSEVEACVLLLPCRHLSLCKGCQSGVDTCPVCHSVVNASLQVIMP